MESIESLISKKATVFGGVYLLKQEDVLKILIECKNQKKIILGIDAFYFSENKIQPILNNSIDFTGQKTYSDNFIKSIELVNKADSSIWFEIVV